MTAEDRSGSLHRSSLGAEPQRLSRVLLELQGGGEVLIRAVQRFGGFKVPGLIVSEELHSEGAGVVKWSLSGKSLLGKSLLSLSLISSPIN